jgi:hypothetical protein
MTIRVRSTPVTGPPDDPDEFRAAKLEMLIAQLVAKQMSGQIGYWAAFSDERGVSHFAFTTDPAYADLSPENAASRTAAVRATHRAIERYRASAPSHVPAAASVTLAAPRVSPPGPEIPVRPREGPMSGAPSAASAGVPICPFLGFKDDPATRYDFPDPRNCCHAASGQGGVAVPSRRQIVARWAVAKGSQLIDVEHQEARCLTAAHGQCARYPAVDGPDSRSGAGSS